MRKLNKIIFINIFEIVWMTVFKLLHLRSSRKATGGFEKKKKFFFFCVRQKLEWLLPNSSVGSRPGLVEAGTDWPWL